jgi:hypothetical protein
VATEEDGSTAGKRSGPCAARSARTRAHSSRMLAAAPTKPDHQLGEALRGSSRRALRTMRPAGARHHRHERTPSAVAGAARHRVWTMALAAPQAAPAAVRATRGARLHLGRAAGRGREPCGTCGWAREDVLPVPRLAQSGRDGRALHAEHRCSVRAKRGGGFPTCDLSRVKRTFCGRRSSTVTSLPRRERIQGAPRLQLAPVLPPAPVLRRAPRLRDRRQARRRVAPTRWPSASTSRT